MEGQIKAGVAREVKTIYKGLSFLERRMVKAYLGFIPIKQIPLKTNAKLRTKDEAPPYVKDILWPDIDKKEQSNPDGQISEEEPYDFCELFNGNTSYDSKSEYVPTIFDYDESNLQKLFEDGKTRSPDEQISLVKMFQV